MRTTILAYAIAFMGLIMIGGGVGPFPFGRNNGSASVEILRNGNRNDIWRPCHGWPCAGLAPATRDKRPRLVMVKPIMDKTSRGRPATVTTVGAGHGNCFPDYRLDIDLRRTS